MTTLYGQDAPLTPVRWTLGESDPTTFPGYSAGRYPLSMGGPHIYITEDVLDQVLAHIGQTEAVFTADDWTPGRMDTESSVPCVCAPDSLGRQLHAWHYTDGDLATDQEWPYEGNGLGREAAEDDEGAVINLVDMGGYVVDIADCGCGHPWHNGLCTGTVGSMSDGDTVAIAVQSWGWKLDDPCVCEDGMEA